MDSESADSSADALSYELLSGMREWRLQHPDATITEIELVLSHKVPRWAADQRPR